MNTPPRVMIVAGSDSSGGAGIQADIRTVTMLGGYAMTAITAITAQNTLGVQAVHAIPPEMLREQFVACADDIGFDAIKIGMLASPAQAETLRELLAAQPDSMPIVLDPVMVATSGSVLASGETIDAFTQLMELATLTTPNLAELDKLGGVEKLTDGGVTFLAKGGDVVGDQVTDTLHRPGREPVSWSAPRIETRHTHGTGCTLASAIACGLGAGLAMETAIDQARTFVRAALAAAPGFGEGHGPMGHQAVMRS